jgi:hypothetical protein
MNIDELVYERSKFREHKNYHKCDEIRDLLDKELVFVFDATWGQQVYYMTDKFFAKKPEGMSHRKFLEKRIADDSRLERIVDAWIKSNS